MITCALNLVLVAGVVALVLNLILPQEPLEQSTSFTSADLEQQKDAEVDVREE